MSFNKIFKELKGEEKKRIESQQVRLKSIMEEILEIVRGRGVTVLELCDILVSLTDMNNQQIATIINKLNNKINDREQPKKDSGSEN